MQSTFTVLVAMRSETQILLGVYYLTAWQCFDKRNQTDEYKETGESRMLYCVVPLPETTSSSVRQRKPNC